MCAIQQRHSAATVSQSSMLRRMDRPVLLSKNAAFRRGIVCAFL